MNKKNLLIVLLCMASFGLQAQDAGTSQKEYGANIISLIPFSGYASEQLGDVMVGLSYEHLLNDFLSVKVPVKFGLTNNAIQGALTAKFYTGGHDSPVSYAIGPTLIFTKGRIEDLRYNYDVDPFGQEYRENTDVTQFGFMMVNSLNITIQKSIYLGLDMGLGLNYLNQVEYNNGDSFDENPGVNFNFDISMGYRF